MDSEDKILQPQNRERKFFSRKFFFLVLLLVVLLLAGATYLLQRPTEENTPRDEENGFMGQASDVSPTPFPFQEMTIPSLRARSYVSSFGEREVISQNASYTSYLTSYETDGLSVNAQLAIPAGQEPQGGWPAIVFIHGYIPPATYQTLVNYASYVDSLARNGFVVLKIDLRGHGTSEGEPSGAYYSGDYIVDTRNAVSALESSGFVNPARIGLWGHSMAGNVVMRTVASKPDIPAAVIWAGAVYSYEDWQKYGIEDNSYRPPGTSSERQRRRQTLFDTHGQFDPESPFWRQVAPTNYLQDVKTAIQLNHAVDDEVVNIGYSRDLAGALEAAGIEFDLREYSSGGHNLSGGTFTQAMQNTADFFKENL